ncbi:glycosyltransferase family 4 protein [Chitinispirillales bacterium ANBcel5]|uniref:glycosyltransferase family 4 protein n=1 Tax=Cellulosispirillum alkaliphilum TaxID=3039283 RepID=UPI002A519D01|nr:glycosyltransferase family 4 protein [Chitinispirillales bacterium ANBcel5]
MQKNHFVSKCSYRHNAGTISIGNILEEGLLVLEKKLRKRKKTVVIIQRVLTHYRIPFVENLKCKLYSENIKLVFVYGQTKAKERERNDTVELKWCKKIKNLYLPFGFVWQPALKKIYGADLIIVEQAHKLLLNYVLFLLRPLFKYKIAFWGHGYCHQQSKTSFSNRIKRRLLKKPDWWFAYTATVADWVIGNGVKKDTVTNVQNAIDTKTLKEYRSNISSCDIGKLKKKMKIPPDAFIGIFCGGMYKEKELRFLVNASKKVVESIPEFQLLLIGNGPDSVIAKEAAKNKSYIHYLGAKFGKEKVLYFAASDLFLLPGLVGLAVLDSFALGLPMVTTDYPYHSPEISYLKHGHNGIITRFDIQSFSNAIVDLLNDTAKRKRITRNAIYDGKKYTIEAMTENFASGIIKALDKNENIVTTQ